VEKLKIKAQGGEKVDRSLAGIKESFPKRKRCRKINFSFGSFPEKMNNAVKGTKIKRGKYAKKDRV